MGVTARSTCLLIGLALVALGWGAGTEQAANTAASTTAAAANEQFAAVGATGCAATACHGSVQTKLPLPNAGSALENTRPVDCWKSSYHQWAMYDKHAHAFDVLKDQRSKDIMRRWKNVESDATREIACLACHVNPTIAEKKDAQAVALHHEGVGCEACHGNAEKWRFAHTGWSLDTDRRASYSQVGMKELFDPAIRAETCAGCHVGAPATSATPLRDVNHDMIAAGHPRLNFEYATYLRKMPPHWRERDRANRGKDWPKGFEADFWAIGQHVVAESTLALLHERLTSADAKNRWPELAEFNCHSCHHDLQPSSWRSSELRPNNAFGAFAWNRPGVRGIGNTKLLESLDAVEKELQRTLTKGADQLPALLAAERQKLYENRPKVGGTIAALKAQLKPDALNAKAIDWDQAARLYALFAAMHNAQPNAANEERLLDLRKALQLPHQEQEQIFDSPKKFTPTEVRDLLRRSLGAFGD